MWGREATAASALDTELFFENVIEKSENVSQIVCGSLIGPLWDCPVLGPRIVGLVVILVFPCFLFKNNFLQTLKDHEPLKVFGPSEAISWWPQQTALSLGCSFFLVCSLKTTFCKVWRNTTHLKVSAPPRLRLGGPRKLFCLRDYRFPLFGL